MEYTIKRTSRTAICNACRKEIGKNMLRAISGFTQRRFHPDCAALEIIEDLCDYAEKLNITADQFYEKYSAQLAARRI